MDPEDNKVNQPAEAGQTLPSNGPDQSVGSGRDSVSPQQYKEQDYSKATKLAATALAFSAVTILTGYLIFVIISVITLVLAVMENARGIQFGAKFNPPVILRILVLLAGLIDVYFLVLVLLSY